MVKVFLLIFFASSLLFFRFVSFYNEQPVYKSGEEVKLEVILQEEPDLSNKGQKFSVKIPTNQTIFITYKAAPRLHYGDQLEISGRLEEKKLEAEKMLLTIYQPKITVRNESKNIIAELAKSIRDSARALYEKSLPPTSASLLMGIVFGAKEHFSVDFKRDLSSTGVLHVIAASGMNVTFVAETLLVTLGYFLRRQFAILIAATAVVFYVFLVGFEASIIRAALMALLAFGANLLGRQQYAVYALFFSGFLMLLWKPALLFDVGFQLSFMATLGILVVEGVISTVTSWQVKRGRGGLIVASPILAVLIESIRTTFAAQITTLPILLGVFGTVGVLSLFVNGIVLWMIPFLMTLGSIAVITDFLFPPLAMVVIYLCLPFLLFFEAVVSFFGSLGWNFALESFSWQMAVGYYLLLGALLLQLTVMKNSKHKITSSI